MWRGTIGGSEVKREGQFEEEHRGKKEGGGKERG